MSLIGNALKALHAYLELRNRTFYYDIFTKSKEKQRKLIYEIEKYRGDQTDSSTQLADLLQSELIAEKQYIKHLSTFYDNPDGEDRDTDS